jgi:hypothetical protein
MYLWSSFNWKRSKFISFLWMIQNLGGCNCFWKLRIGNLGIITVTNRFFYDNHQGGQTFNFGHDNFVFWLLTLDLTLHHILHHLSLATIILQANKLYENPTTQIASTNDLQIINIVMIKFLFLHLLTPLPRAFVLVCFSLTRKNGIIE